MTAQVHGAAAAGSKEEYPLKDKCLKISYQAKVCNPTDQSKPPQ